MLKRGDWRPTEGYGCVAGEMIAVEGSSEEA